MRYCIGHVNRPTCDGRILRRLALPTLRGRQGR